MSTETRMAGDEHGQTCTPKFPSARPGAPERENLREIALKLEPNLASPLYQPVDWITLWGERCRGSNVDRVLREENSKMSTRLSVYVCSDDPITEAGVAAQMRGRPEVYVVEAANEGAVDVTVVVVEELDEASECRIRNLRRTGHEHVVVVCSHIDDGALMRAVELGVSGLLRRTEATPERLSSAVVAASRGDGQMAPDLLGRLLEQMSRLQQRVLAPKGISPNGFTRREIEVLRLLAEGYDTSEIADTLAYSERTIKNVIHDVTSRLHLRNRSHAVAFAMRTGVI